MMEAFLKKHETIPKDLLARIGQLYRNAADEVERSITGDTLRAFESATDNQFTVD